MNRGAEQRLAVKPGVNPLFKDARSRSPSPSREPAPEPAPAPAPAPAPVVTVDSGVMIRPPTDVKLHEASKKLPGVSFSALPVACKRSEGTVDNKFKEHVITMIREFIDSEKPGLLTEELVKRAVDNQNLNKYLDESVKIHADHKYRLQFPTVMTKPKAPASHVNPNEEGMEWRLDPQCSGKGDEIHIGVSEETGQAYIHKKTGGAAYKPYFHFYFEIEFEG